MYRTTSSAGISSRAPRFASFDELPKEVQGQVVEHAADDPSQAGTLDGTWTSARRNAALCTVSKRFHECAQPYVHLSYFHTLALLDCGQPAPIRSGSVKQDLLTTDPRVLYRRLETMPERIRSLTPVQRLQVLVDAHLRIATKEDFEACLHALMGLVEAASAMPMAKLPHRAIPTLIAIFLCRSLTNLQEGNAWHLSAMHRLRYVLSEVLDDRIAAPALLQIAVITMVYEHLGHPMIALRTGNSEVRLSTGMVLGDLQSRAGLRQVNEEGLRAVAAVLASKPDDPPDAKTIASALRCLETLDHPLIGFWAASLNKLQSLTLTRESRERLDRCAQKAQQNGWAPGNAPPSQLLLSRV